MSAASSGLIPPSSLVSDLRVSVFRALGCLVPEFSAWFHGGVDFPPLVISRESASLTLPIARLSKTIGGIKHEFTPRGSMPILQVLAVSPTA